MEDYIIAQAEQAHAEKAMVKAKALRDYDAVEFQQETCTQHIRGAVKAGPTVAAGCPLYTKTKRNCQRFAHTL